MVPQLAVGVRECRWALLFFSAHHAVYCTVNMYMFCWCQTCHWHRIIFNAPVVDTSLCIFIYLCTVYTNFVNENTKSKTLDTNLSVECKARARSGLCLQYLVDYKCVDNML